MHGLPNDLDYSVFGGRALEGVDFRAYTIRLWFDGELAISMESSYSHQLPDGREPDVINVPSPGSTLIQLIGQTIESACAEGKGTLALSFDGGHTLRIFDDNPMYECYEIHALGRDYYV